MLLAFRPLRLRIRPSEARLSRSVVKCMAFGACAMWSTSSTQSRGTLEGDLKTFPLCEGGKDVGQPVSRQSADVNAVHYILLGHVFVRLGGRSYSAGT